MPTHALRPLLVASLVAALGIACNVQTGGTSGNDSLLSSSDGAAPTTEDGSVNDLDAGPRPAVMDASPKPPEPACYRAGNGSTGHQFAPPVLHQNVCSLAQREAFRDACLGDRKSAACVALRQAEATCGRCIFGPAGPGPEESTVPMGVFLFGPDKPGKATVNTQGCAALAAGWPGCAWPSGVLQTCVENKCEACTTDADKAACRVLAQDDACSGHNLRNCSIPSSRWISSCERATPEETFMRVAEVFCGAP